MAKILYRFVPEFHLVNAHIAPFGPVALAAPVPPCSSVSISAHGLVTNANNVAGSFEKLRKTPSNVEKLRETSRNSEENFQAAS
jgi:hypothetical protein